MGMYVRDLKRTTSAKLWVVNVNGHDVIPRIYNNSGIADSVHKVVDIKIMDSDALAISIVGGTGTGDGILQGYTKL